MESGRKTAAVRPVELLGALIVPRSWLVGAVLDTGDGVVPCAFTGVEPESTTAIPKVQVALGRTFDPYRIGRARLS